MGDKWKHQGLNTLSHWEGAHPPNNAHGKHAAGAVATPPQSPTLPNKRAAEPHYSANTITFTCDQSPPAYKSPADPELSAETY